ncbi:MAG: TonB-dependent receptor domain-containing protein [Steroidobacteraceae bacterium]
MRFPVSAAVLLTSMPAYGLAQDNPFSLEQIVITPSMMPQPVLEAISSVTVITRADIDRLQPRSVADLLQGMAGVSVVNNGGLGETSSVSIRGTNSDHVLVLIDGIKIGSATTGTAAWEQLPVSQIERIVIVRGPYSSLYGSGAIGGVIEIFTRQGASGEPSVPSFSASGGSRGTYRVQLGDSGSARNGWYNASVSGLYTHGFPICVAGAPPTASCYTTSPQQGFWNSSAAESGGYRWSKATGTVDFLRTDGDNRYDGNIYAGGESRVVQQVLGGTLTTTPLSVLTVMLSAGQSKDLSQEYFGGAPDGYFDTARDTASWVNQLSLLHGQKLLLGADYERDVVSSDTAYPVTSRRDAGEFGLYQWLGPRAELQLSLRDDRNQQFGGHSTWSAQWAYRFSTLLRASASYGIAFKAPTFNDLYFPDYGDPTLRPETSHSAEVGLNGHSTHFLWALSAYETRVENLIEYDPVTFGAANIDVARIRGVDTRLGGWFDGWRGQLQLTALDPRDVGVDYGALLPRIARFTERLDLDRAFGPFGIGTTLIAVAPRYEDPANTERMGGYSTLDLRASWLIRPHWEVQVLLANACNRSYETALYYNQPGRSAYLTLRYVPNSHT